MFGTACDDVFMTFDCISQRIREITNDSSEDLLYNGDGPNEKKTKKHMLFLSNGYVVTYLQQVQYNNVFLKISCFFKVL